MALVSNTPDLLFTDQVDVDTDEGMVEEMYNSMIQHHPYHVLDQTAMLNIYGEPEDEPVYTTVAPSFPLHVKLNPQLSDLNRYGYDRQRDAIVWFCSKIMRDRDLKPKVGDRIDFVYLDAQGQTVREHLILTETSEQTFARQTKVPYQITAAAMRTERAKKP